MQVIDLSRLLPGPYCSRILADLGFDVVKVEPPGGGDWSRYAPPLDGESGEGLLFRSLNRGKRSLALNLKAAPGRAILLRLAAGADVLFDSFRPGTLERLGLGREVLAGANPRLVTCSLSGYGSAGAYRRRAGHDLNFVGLAGLLDLNGPRQGAPVVPGVPVADLAGGLWAVVGILAALLERERTGRGQHVDASLLGGALSFLPLAVAGQQGGRPLARGESELGGGRVCYNVYETRDGAYVTVGALEPEFWAAFCRAAGCEDLLGQQFAPAVSGEPAYEALQALFRTRTRQEWAALLAGVDACCEPVYTVAEALESAPVRALGMLADGLPGLLPACRLSARGPDVGTREAAALGQHTGEILAGLGYDPAAIDDLRRQGVV